jgi:O-antigen chain-terminating methyltransferase
VDTLDSCLEALAAEFRGAGQASKRLEKKLAQALSELKNSTLSQAEELEATNNDLQKAVLAWTQGARSLEDKLTETFLKTKEAQEAQDRQLSDLKAQLKNLEIALERKLPDLALRDEGRSLLETGYLAFENHFRGSRENIIERLRVYLPILESVATSPEENLLVDLGCGRGEWLELVRTIGFRGRGVDTNVGMVELCQSLNLDVAEADVLHYLEALPEESIKIISAFHLIEHLRFEDLLLLMQGAHRALHPGGLLILETPNPENILVGSQTFWQDPTHLRPLPSSLLSFFLGRIGFAEVKLLDLNPLGVDSRLEGSRVGEVVAERISGPQDYAVIASKGKRF